MNAIENVPPASVRTVPCAISCREGALRAVRETPIPPVGMADLANDVIADRGSAHRCAVGMPRRGLPTAFLAERGCLGGVERHLEFRPLVFFDV